MRLIPQEALDASAHYGDLAELATIFNHGVVEDEQGTWRWQRNKLMRLLLDGDAPFYEGADYHGERTRVYRGSLSLNELCGDHAQGKFTTEEWMKFYMGIGYSLGGFCEVFGQRRAVVYVDDAEGDEDLIDYMKRKHAGQVLAL